MIYLADTNVLLRFAWRSLPEHQVVRAAMRKLKQGGHEIQATSQNFIECWTVATRPAANNGLGLSTAGANRLLKLIERLFPRCADTDLIYNAWRSLVISFGVSGRPSHDARLVAVMQVHGITHILTFNTKDFVRYANAGIVAVDPAMV